VLILPECNQPISDVAVPAGGSVSGTINFFPPPSVTGSEVSRNSSRRPSQSHLPLALGLAAGLGLLGVRSRKLLHTHTALVIAAAGFFLAGLDGCGGKGWPRHDPRHLHLYDQCQCTEQYGHRNYPDQSDGALRLVSLNPLAVVLISRYAVSFSERILHP
jgi:hypothetical protein